MTEGNPFSCDAADVIDLPEQKMSFRPLPFLFVIAISAVLCFYSLGRRTLWEDEGETAVLAQRVLTEGFPKALKGSNLVFQGGKPGYDEKYRWIFHPWGQFYVAAAGLAIFGNTTFAARFPFALCGVLTVALLYLFIWRHWRSSTIAALGALLLATSTMFVLHCRQCRYYGLSAFTCLMLMAVFVELVNKPSWKWWIGFGLALAAQFYTDFGTLMVILPGLLLSLLLIRVGKKEVIAAAKGFAIAFLLIFPGLMLHWERLTSAGEGGHNLLETLMGLLVHICYFDAWYIPIVFAAPAAGIFIWRILESGKKYVGEQDRIVIICSLALIFGMTGMAWVAPYPHLRFVIPQMSFARLLLAVILAGFYGMLCKKPLPLWSAKLLLTVVAVMLAFTNIFSLPVKYFVDMDKYPLFRLHLKDGPFERVPFAGLIYELTHDFVCGNRVTLNVADDFADADETVLIDHGDLPLMFYRPDLKIYTPDTQQNMRNAPDLAVLAYNSLYSHYVEVQLEKMRDQYGCDYGYIIISIPAAMYGNIPEPRAHYFVTPSSEAPFVVYLRSDHWDRVNRLPHSIEALQTRWYRFR